MNRTPYFVHFLHPDESYLYVPPGEGTSLSVDGDATVTVVIAPGQVVKGRSDAHTSCCSDDSGTDCSSVTANWQDGNLVARAIGPSCNTEGSCPYVYAFDGRGFVLEGEPLVGALNHGARQTDALILSHLKSQDGRYRVRIATELHEINYIDAVALQIVDHPEGSLMAPDDNQVIHGVDAPVPPLGAVDASGIDCLAELGANDGRFWEGAARKKFLDGKIRDWVVLEFPRPPEAKQATLLVQGRNTRFAQDAYHAYMQQFGPGLPKLIRLTSSWPWYRHTMKKLLRESGFSMDVAVGDGPSFKRAGTIGPIGPAGVQTVAVHLKLPAEPSRRLRLRLAILPGAWLLDSARVGYRQPALQSKLLDPRSARLAGRNQEAQTMSLDAIMTIDESYQSISVGQSLELEFEAPPVAGPQRTAVLHLTGYYEELDRSPRPCVNWRPLLQSCIHDNSFARFVVDRLRWRDVVDEHADLAGVERKR